MSFKEFDLSDYIKELERFKLNNAEEIIEYWGSTENFNMFIQKIKSDEDYVAKIAIQEFGSIEKYTEAMKHNMNVSVKLIGGLRDFSEYGIISPYSSG